jgi:fumarate hydratase subunit alpha
MRIIDTSFICETVRRLFIEANYKLPDDAQDLIYSACGREQGKLGRAALLRIYENLGAAARLDIPICQDTGMAVLFADVGQQVAIEGGLFEDAVNEGVRLAYRDGYMRCSVVEDPLFGRKNTEDNTPAVIYTRLVAGDKIKLTAAPKGFGSENMSALRMFTPSATRDDIIAFVAETVKTAGSNPCPPILIGVGIGGTFDYCAVLAKRALVRPVSFRNQNPGYAALENDILEKVNTLGIGPQGFGGNMTALAVNIEYMPTHIAGLPVAVNINCHVMRHAEAVI